MLKFAMTALTGVALALTAPVAAQNATPGKSADAPGQDRVCLITWATAADAATGADATALSGKYLPRKAAEAQAAQSGGKSRVFDYSNSTQHVNTGHYVITNNDEERAFCEGPEFNPGLRQ
ncbi:MAG TPA: hypothetical protein VEA61_06370 [Allosphingosinicella sp.]|nr:hypothetical protein [Allosphingosinicella sp.]